MKPSQPVFIIPSQLGKDACPLHKIAIEVSQPVLGLHILRNLAEEKLNMVAVNMSKRGPITCVISCFDETVILHFCSFSFLENSIIKLQEVDTNLFSD